MAQNADLSPRAQKALLWTVLIFLVPVLGVLGWVGWRLSRPPEACPLCGAVASGDPARVQTAINSGGVVTPAAWHDALERLRAAAGSGGPPVAIVTLLLQHGADANEFWRPVGSYAIADGNTGSLRLGNTTFTTGGSVRPSRKRVFAAEVAVENSDDLALIDLFLAKGLDVHGLGAGEALVSAARLRRVNTARRLLDAGVPASYAANEAPRRTALAEAIQTLDIDLIAALEQKGAREW